MDQPFEVTEDGKVRSVEVGCDTSQVLVSVEKFGITLPVDIGKDREAKADLLERRLSSLEQALDLNPFVTIK
ncbi:hypothetical protein [Pseudomonas sp. G1002]|uniref:hypothetical protein n=1 Tax=Pseudomonas sp. G1002 TaxID=410942 RepID=UPI0015A372C7|nr:hypothetical protein [Pseudomonas sp. G1002]NWC06582.1 hypothetical protein [Pseudomonas sp. G1002]